MLGNDTFCPGGEFANRYALSRFRNAVWNTKNLHILQIEEAGIYTLPIHYGPGDYLFI
ncbi:MAG: hypothetical protein IPL48_16040 [Bacteroidetes bacterium]|nr:hypothetical protein [Bacteroidota bacterium]